MFSFLVQRYRMQVLRGPRPEIIDERGSITCVLDTATPIRSVLLITSKAGSVRSNHYHQADAHYCYVVSGRAEWWERPLHGGTLEKAVLEPGDVVYTPPMTVHAVKFLADSVLLACSTKPRNQADYEADTVRVTLMEE